MKMYKVIQILLQLCFTFSSVEAFAAFGSSCPTALLPSSGGDNYLKEYTVYGHIISNIDMTVITDGCKAEDKQFKFCVKYNSKI